MATATLVSETTGAVETTKVGHGRGRLQGQHFQNMLFSYFPYFIKFNVPMSRS
jgi:hypothetical protein